MSLITRYRPQKFSQVIGQDSIVRSLEQALKKNLSRAFLFVGPSGVGKTTFAHIIASELKCQPLDLIEEDGATRTGIDDMRAIQEALHYRPLGEGTVKVVIIDECHYLSKNAWNSLLKIIEDPPPWAYWCFCTTEGTKVPASIKTRCLTYELKPVPVRQMLELLSGVVEEEKLKVNSAVITLCAQEADGSPRQALANLAACAEAKSVAEAQELLRTAVEESAAIDLARALYKGVGWRDLHAIMSRLNGINPESVRRVVLAYGAKVVLSGAGVKADVAGPILEVMDAFSQPFYGMDGLVLACGRLTLMD
jgi:DNA polymerase III subunit gamma/tau